MNKLTNKLSVLCVSVLLFSQYLYGQNESNAQAKESSFVLKVTYKNYGKKSKHLVKVGIKVSNVSDGPPTCAFSRGLSFRPPVGSYFSDTLQLQANYIVNLHISNNETIIDANPPIAIKPDEAEYFTISFLPSAVGYCSSLISFEVSGILIFDDGEKVYITPKQNRITREEVEKFIERTPDEAELLSAINHRNIVIRRQAASQLSKSTLKSEELKFLINQGLSNEDPGIRAATAISASKLGFKIFTKKISSLLEKSLIDFDTQVKLNQEKLREKEKTVSSLGLILQKEPVGTNPKQQTKSSNSETIESILKSRYESLISQTEIADYCVALGELQDADGIDILMSTLINLNFEYPEKASDALIKLNHPDVINKIRPLLLKNIEWSSEKNSYLQERYSEIYKIVIAYRDIKSIETVLILANKSDELLYKLVSETHSITRKNQIIRDPFILAMRPAFEKALKDSYSGTRFYALEVLCQMAISNALILNYLRLGIKDSDHNNRRNSALLAADLGYKELIKDIEAMLKIEKENWTKEGYCEALKRLEAPCK